MQLPQLFDFEIEAQKLLRDGGIKNKNQAEIQQTSQVIKDKIDNQLELVFQRYHLMPDFFISSKNF